MAPEKSIKLRGTLSKSRLPALIDLALDFKSVFLSDFSGGFYFMTEISLSRDLNYF